MSEQTVGSIVGTLRLDIASFEEGIAKAQALADHLDGKNVDVNVKVETGGAETKLAEVAASEEAVDRGNKKVAQSGQDAGKGLGLMGLAIVGLGPAIVPLAVGASGLAVGFGAMGAAGVLALVGIKAQMSAGTPVGFAYTAMVGTLRGDLTQLGRTAAAGTLAPFQASVASLQTKMPALNGIIGEFSVITGKTAGALTTGLVAAFITLEPLARDAGVYILTLSQRFAGMMSGPGVVTFGDYARSVLPQVTATLESVVTAAVRLVAALAPMGLGTLSMLKTFADLLNALPVDGLAVLAQGASSVYLGFKSFSLLSTGITAVGTALKAVGVSAEAAASGMAAMNIAAGVVGVLIAVATLAFSAHASAVQGDQAAVNSLTDALIANGGVINDNAVAQQAHTLALNGTLAAAKLLGYGLDDVTLASMGNADALARVNAHTNDLVKTYGGVAPAAEKAGKSLEDGLTAYNLVNDAVTSGATNLDLATQAYNAYNVATAKAAAGGNAQAIAQQALAAKIGTTAAALATAADGQQKTADAAAAAAAKMYMENDAAGLLRGTLDLLNGKAISAADAQNSFDSSLVNMGDHTTATGKAITWTTTSIKDMSSASVALRGQLDGQVTNLQRVVEANGGLANSTGSARAQMVTMRQQIIDNAVAHGVNRAAVTSYIDKLLAIPKTLPPTKLDVDKAAAQAKLDAFDKASAAATRNRAMSVRANIADAAGAISALERLLNTIPTSRTITMYVAAGANNAQALNYINTTNKLAGMPQANGGMLANAAGSITAFAGGGESHVAQIAPAGAMRLWAEPETGGEAYIPLAPSKRARSLAILDETSKALGRSAAGADMSGVRADLAEQTAEIRNLVAGFGAELQKQARMIQTMQRQN